MSKPRPMVVHVNSKGKKQYKLQELIYSQDSYVFIPIDGKMKTDFFNKGFIDGRKRPKRLEMSYDSCPSTKEILAFSSIEYSDKISNQMLTGVVPLNHTFLISTREADRFLSHVCQLCEYYGEPNCFRADFLCAHDDRDKYRDSTWFSLKKEASIERKQHAFPVMG
ncbi:hypothetical protein P4K96_30660 [Bacillus cereus]|nr:hypothetical protein [Bacillus cereus]